MLYRVDVGVSDEVTIDILGGSFELERNQIYQLACLGRQEQERGNAYCTTSEQ